MSQIYQRRRDLVAEGLRAIGLDVEPPRATPYFWARVPEGHTSASFAELVLDRANVVISPGGAYGPSGEGFVRISLTVADDRLEEAVDRIASMGSDAQGDMGQPRRPVISDGRAGGTRTS
jgi:LL-diaminopimelate aminotransferase